MSVFDKVMWWAGMAIYGGFFILLIPSALTGGKSKDWFVMILVGLLMMDKVLIRYYMLH